MNDPRVLLVISLVFVLLGLYNLSIGRRKIREARLAGSLIRWHKQISVLTGIEYLMLSFVFLLDIANRQGGIAPGLRDLIVPLYAILLSFSAVLAVIVIRQGLRNTRTLRANARNTEPSIQANQKIEPASPKDYSEEQMQQQHKRRKKAASARRRRAGRF